MFLDVIGLKFIYMYRKFFNNISELFQNLLAYCRYYQYYYMYLLFMDHLLLKFIFKYPNIFYDNPMLSYIQFEQNILNQYYYM